MKPLSQLKQEVELNQSLGEIIAVLKMATAVQLRQMQGRPPWPEGFRQHLAACLGILRRQAVSHPFFVAQEHLPACVAVITSDEGFAGDLNNALIEAALAARRAARGDPLVVLGERGAAYVEELGHPFVYFPGVSGEGTRQDVDPLKQYLVRGYLAGRFGKVSLVAATCARVGTHQVETDVLLPCREPAAQGVAPPLPTAWLLEPSASRVADAVGGLWVEAVLAARCRSSKLAELSARLMHLEGGDQELSRANQVLARQYGTYVHARANKAILEIAMARVNAERSPDA